MAAVAAPPPEAVLYYDALLGPLCASLDVWRTTYMHRLPDAGGLAPERPPLAKPNPNPKPQP